jgi:hypothetical protein
MGDLNQLDFVLENRDRVEGPILEIGSRDHGNTNDLRGHFPGLRYVGADMEAGKGVDVVCDFIDPLEVVDARLGRARFRTVVCFSVMEHCRQPFRMAENITAVTVPGAWLFLSVPWVWNMHGFPDDYWRFTPSAVRLLFPQFRVLEERSFWSTKNRGERFPLSVKKLNLHEEAFFKTPALAEELRRQGLTNFQHPYYCYPVMLNMLLERQDARG